MCVCILYPTEGPDSVGAMPCHAMACHTTRSASILFPITANGKMSGCLGVALFCQAVRQTDRRKQKRRAKRVGRLGGGEEGAPDLQTLVANCPSFRRTSWTSHRKQERTSLFCDKKKYSRTESALGQQYPKSAE